MMNVLKLYRCPNCITKKKHKSNLIKRKNGLECNNCKDFFPFYKKLPVMLLFKNDFYHVKKALTSAKYRVNKYENKFIKNFTKKLD